VAVHTGLLGLGGEALQDKIVVPAMMVIRPLPAFVGCDMTGTAIGGGPFFGEFHGNLPESLVESK
jgi:hypothetical protein